MLRINKSIFSKIESTSREQDPTRTLVLRSNFVREVETRFKKIQDSVYVYVGEGDCFGLEKPTTLSKEYKDKSDSDKLLAFLLWLRTEVDSFIYQSSFSFSKKGMAIWYESYLTTAYNNGIEQARADLKALNIVLSETKLPFNDQRLELLYTQANSSMKGIIEAMLSKISKTAAQGLSANIDPITLAESFKSDISDIGMNRGKGFARTEIVNSFNEGILKITSEVETLTGKPFAVQWVTALDEKVCSVCGPRHGMIYSVDAARTIIGPHPNCRCGLIPYMIEGGN